MIEEQTFRRLKGEIWVFDLFVRDGSAPRQLVSNNDVLKFTIAEFDQRHQVQVSRVTNDGIIQGDDGRATVTVPGSSMNQAQLPKDLYYVEIWLEGRPDALIRGPLHLTRTSRG